LGLWIEDNLKWQTNTDYIIGKAVKRLFLLKMLKKFGADKIDMERFYISAIRPTLEYGAQVWHGGLTRAQSSSIEEVQRRALRIIYSEKDYEKLLLKAGMHTLEQRRNTIYIFIETFLTCIVDSFRNSPIVSSIELLLITLIFNITINLY
jgi:hypothetical protein